MSGPHIVHRSRFTFHNCKILQAKAVFILSNPADSQCLEFGDLMRFGMIWEAEKYVKIAELYLEDDDPVAADTFCSRAAMVMHEAHGIPWDPMGNALSRWQW